MTTNKPLSRLRKAGYGSTELGLVAVEVLIQVYLLKFYNVVVGLPATLTGIALAIGILWDAVTDPLMGALSDRTRTRWGKRRPFFLPGAIALSVFFIGLFNPPAMNSDAVKFIYLIFGFLLVSTSTTVLSVPHIALGGELSFDRHERTVIYGYRRLFSTLGLVVGTILPALVLSSLGGGEDPEAIASSRGITALVLAIPVILTALVAFFATKGYDESAPVVSSGPRVSTLRTLGGLILAQKEAWKNRIFLPLLLAFLVAGMARTLNGSIALYYYEYRLELSEQVVVLAILLPFFLALLASIPLWIQLSRRFGKKWPAFYGVMGLGLLSAIFYPIFPAGSVQGPIVLAIVGGFFAGSIVLLDSLIPDTVDYDELKTGENREGLYFGVWKLGTKLARAGGLLVAGVLLDSIGFQEGAATQAEEVGWRLALLFGPVVGFFFMVGGLIFTRMPLTDALHARVQKLLVRKRRRRNRKRLPDSGA